MLVCAFCGSTACSAAYAHAIAHGYRFYSYGDACLLFRAASTHERAFALRSARDRRRGPRRR